MLKKLILRNAKRQLGDYVLYCITIACAVACMYAYNALLFSDKVRQLPELEVLPYMIIAVTLLIILVMGWLVSYMTGYMLKRRSRELSLYMVSGLSARTIAGLFLYENLIIAGTAFIAGLPAGILLSWLVESAVLKMFGMTFTLGFSVSFKTAGLTQPCICLPCIKVRKGFIKYGCTICCIMTDRLKAAIRAGNHFSRGYFCCHCSFLLQVMRLL